MIMIHGLTACRCPMQISSFVSTIFGLKLKLKCTLLKPKQLCSIYIHNFLINKILYAIYLFTRCKFTYFALASEGLNPMLHLSSQCSHQNCSKDPNLYTAAHDSKLVGLLTKYVQIGPSHQTF